MKKTFTANLNGIVFHIEEDAYDQLQRYLANIRAKFSGSAEAEEVMADIEARIAELFTERLQGRQAVSMADVDHVKQVMGQPEDYVDSEPSGDGASGTGHPESGAAQRRHKRLFRDTDDRWVAGVIGGLANYFGTEALWFRIAFLVVVVAGWGSPVLLYILMWMLVPEATSAAEKLEMRGEPVTVDNIKRMFEEGAERVKTGAGKVADEARTMGRKYWNEGQHQGREAGRRVEGAAHRLFDALGKVLGVFLLIIAIVLGLSVVASLVGSTAAWSNGSFMGGNGIMGWAGLLFPSMPEAVGFTLSAVLLFMVPILLLLLASLWLLFRVRVPRWAGISLTVVFIAALAVCVWTGIRLGMDFRSKAEQVTEQSITAPYHGTLHVRVRDPHLAGRTMVSHGISYSNWIVRWDNDLVELENDTAFMPFSNLQVEQSPDSAWHLSMRRMARGGNGAGARERTANIRAYAHYEADTVSLSSWYSFPAHDLLRGQRVVHMLQVPLGGRVHFLPGSQALMSDCAYNGRGSDLDDDMVGRTWTMTKDGLKSVENDTLPAIPEPVPTPPAPAPPAGGSTIGVVPIQATLQPAMPNLLHLLGNFIRP